MNKKIKIVKYKSKEYTQALQVRYNELRKPIGLEYNEELLLKDEQDIHIVYLIGNTVVGTLILTILDNDNIQLRQFAVSSKQQGKGIGRDLYFFAEEYAITNNFKILKLNARTSVLSFYLKLGLESVGNEYISSNSLLPHYKMFKNLA